jgi:peptide N-acetyl-beta-D-glucosaminyl asparaginase amidase A/PKD domain-containing protein
MSARWLAVAAALLLLGGLSPLLASAALDAPHGGGFSSRASTATAASPSSPDPSAPRSILPSSLLNATYVPREGYPSALPPPVSVVGAEPDPSVPRTLPSVIVFPVNISSGAAKQNFTAPPGGPWARIILNFTGTVVPDVYDSSYRAYVDGVLVLFGTTPEYGTWTVLRDLTEYSALFVGTVNLYFQLSAADITGHFLENVTLSFYPVGPGTAPPAEANDVLPLWSTPYVHSTTPVAWGYQTVPSNVTNATLELWTYGFGTQDEFWYLQSPGYRALQLSVDGTRFITLLPFEYINTGGIDLFLWRPVTGVLTTNDRPEQFDATPMLGLLEGYHNFSVTMEGITSPGSSWLIGGTLLLNTSAGTGAATTTRFVYSGEAVQSSGLDRAVNYTYEYGSSIPTRSGVERANETLGGIFSSNVSEFAGWQNLSMNERTVTNATETLAGRLLSTQQTLDFPFTVDLTGTFQLTRTTGGGYPEYGNFTTEMLACIQDWGETINASASGGGLPFVSSERTLSFRLDGANGIYGGTEELTSPGVPVITGLTSSSSSTPKTVSLREVVGGTDGSYLHTLVGTGYNPPGPYNVETIQTNQVSASLSAAVALSRPVVEIGGAIQFRATVTGGAGWIDYAWTGLPSGCAGVDAATVSCTPSTSGTYVASVLAKDAVGDAIEAAALPLLVAGPVAALITGAPVASDSGVSLSLAAEVAGGIAPYECSWSVDGAAISIQACGAPFNYTLATSGTYSFSLQAVDAGGVVLNATPVTVLVSQPPQLSLSAPSGTLTAGNVFTFTAGVVNGTAPFTYTWDVDGRQVASGPDSELNYSFTSAGTHNVDVSATDAAGLSTVAPSRSVTIAATSSGGGSSGGLPSSFWPTVAIASQVVAALFLVLFLLARRRPRRSPATSKATPSTAPKEYRDRPNPPPPP